MNEHWSIETHGDPLGSVRDLIRDIWRQAGLAGMLVTMDEKNGSSVSPRYITDPADIDGVNPFKPLMEMNIARMVPGLLASHPSEHIAAIFRPCEMRALVEMTRHAGIDVTDLLTISVDCLGTLPADEYQWRLERNSKLSPALAEKPAKGDNNLADEALQFARQGGIIPYRYRSACQVCISPAASQADINISILGLPVRQSILVSVTKPTIAQFTNLEKFSASPANEESIADHERTVSRMNERHGRTLERIQQDLGKQLPGDVDALIRQLETCGDCQDCLDACPICSVDRPYRDANGHYDRAGVTRWLVSCAGCGMCEQACTNDLPISSIFTHIHQQLDQEWQ